MTSKLLNALVTGVVFGLGLAIAQMSDPAKIFGFLDIAGNWDPSLLVVLGGAVAVTVIAFRFVLQLPHPMFDRVFEKPNRTQIDHRLVAGAALFGVGWGLAGYCPGPGVVSLARLAPDGALFLAMFVIGSCLYRAFGRGRQTLGK